MGEGPKKHVRLDDAAIKRLFDAVLGVAVTSISEIPISYNNRCYIVWTPTTSYVLRLSPSKIFPQKSENEIAALSVIRQRTTIPVPTVYASFVSHSHQVSDIVPSQLDWMIMEHMSGVTLEEVWNELGEEDKLGIVDEIGKYVAQMRSIRFKGFGGLRTQPDGTVAVGKTVLEPYAGPLPSVSAFYREKARFHIKNLRENKFLSDWSDLEEPLRRFEEGIEVLLQGCEDEEAFFCHGDLERRNILVTPTQPHRITALLDFEFSSAASRAEDFCLSFSFMSASFPNPFEHASIPASVQPYSVQESRIRERFLCRIGKPAFLDEKEVLIGNVYHVTEGIHPWWLYESDWPKEGEEGWEVQIVKKDKARNELERGLHWAEEKIAEMTAG
ncbi:kinase-like protein [Atractiella rhizophila]|nr:kinase-like protein [Atractiella rhizophila]KAH8927594.1 kinase-like protein [Atractiella rhizophila]